jgi:transcription initiation factor TFIIIB Brf1 subunit/transcription initiation factor TFIIB
MSVVHGVYETMRLDIGGSKTLQRLAERCIKEATKNSAVMVLEKDLHMMKTALERIGLERRDDAVLLASELYTKAFNEERRTSTKSLVMAVCAYYACKFHKRGHTPEGMCVAFGVTDIKRFWQSVVETVDTWKSLRNFKELMLSVASEDLMTRMVYSVPTISEDQQWNVLKAARQLEARLGGHAVFKTLKPSKFNVALIYVACRLVGCEEVTKSALAQGFGVAMNTVNKHEGLIQTYLVTK